MSEKRNMIFEAAITLFAADGFWKTSTASIAKKAGVANGTLFNCFASKEVLIDEIYSGVKGELFQAISQGMPRDARLQACLDHVWKGVVNWALDHPVRWRLMEQLRLSELVSSETKSEVAKDFQFIHGMVEQGIQDGELVDLPLEYHLEIMIGQITAIVSYLSSLEVPSDDRLEIIDKGFSSYWAGVSRKV